MFSDPITVTHDGVATDLVRVAYGDADTGRPSLFVNAGSDLLLSIQEIKLADSRRFEVELSTLNRDPDSNPVTGPASGFPNKFGFVFEVHPSMYNAGLDLPLLQSAISSLVDDTFRNRLLSGEK